MAKLPSKTTVINKNDKLSRELNILLNGLNCEKCGRDGNVYKIDWAHVEPRELKCIRWNPLNWMRLCFTCHKWWHNNPTRSAIWFDEKYGEERKKKLWRLQRVYFKGDVHSYLRIQKKLKKAL